MWSSWLAWIRCRRWSDIHEYVYMYTYIYSYILGARRSFCLPVTTWSWGLARKRCRWYTWIYMYTLILGVSDFLSAFGNMEFVVRSDTVRVMGWYTWICIYVYVYTYIYRYILGARRSFCRMMGWYPCTYLWMYLFWYGVATVSRID